MVTVRLSKKFSEAFGEELTSELMDWFNKMELSYRSDLHSLNEANVIRFESRMDQKFAEYDSKWEARSARLEVNWEKRLSDIERGFSETKANLIKWMFIFWAGSTATVVGTMIALVKL